MEPFVASRRADDRPPGFSHAAAATCQNSREISQMRMNFGPASGVQAQRKACKQARFRRHAAWIAPRRPPVRVRLAPPEVRERRPLHLRPRRRRGRNVGCPTVARLRSVALRVGDACASPGDRSNEIISASRPRLDDVRGEQRVHCDGSPKPVPARASRLHVACAARPGRWSFNPLTGPMTGLSDTRSAMPRRTRQTMTPRADQRRPAAD